MIVRGSDNRITINDSINANAIAIEVWAKNGNLTIGSNTQIMELKLHLAESETSIKIDEECLIASDVEIRSGDSHAIYDCDTGERLNSGKSVSIGKNVWIAKDVKILKGSIIPAGSVVSTGSIVTKKFEYENALYAGVPAVLKRKNIRWEYPIGK